MKDYCPECGQVMDETEFMQNNGVCNNCVKKKGNIGGNCRDDKDNGIMKEHNFNLSI